MLQTTTSKQQSTNKKRLKRLCVTLWLNKKNIKQMKKLFLISFLMMFCCVAYSQEKLSTTNKKAIKFYEVAMATKPPWDTREAFIGRMEQAIKLDKLFTEAYWAISDITYHYDTDYAIKMLNSLIENNAPRETETLIKLAEIYYETGKNYLKAIEVIEKISDEKFITKKNELLEKYRIVYQLFIDTVPFTPKNLELVNTELDEYFPSITADGKVLSITRSLQSSRNTQEDLYYSTNLNGTWLPLMPLNGLNTSENEGSQSFSADGRYMFFVACNRRINGGCDIYYSINNGGVWGNPIPAPFPVNSGEWDSNPVLSPAGNELFFVSNRKPNFGGKDIWHCDVKILDGGILQFSNAKNLGKPINTAGNDFAPFIHADNKTLYFASDRHPGLGGSDIFVSWRDENGVFSEPKNLGYPINTTKDEYGIVVSAKGNQAYISSWNNENPSRRLDIYQFELYPEISPKTMGYVVGNVYDAVTFKKLDAAVEVYDYETQKTISHSISDKKSGNFTAFLPDEGQFGLNVRRTGYLFYSSKITSKNDSLKVALQPIKKGEKIILNNIFFAFNSAELQHESEKEINEIFNFLQQNITLKIEIVGHTDNIGSEKFNLTLSENRAAAVRNALITKGISAERLTSKGLGFSQPIDTNTTDEGREKNRRVECVIL